MIAEALGQSYGFYRGCREVIRTIGSWGFRVRLEGESARRSERAEPHEQGLGSGMTAMVGT